jgi:hypothetical protein
MWLQVCRLAKASDKPRHVCVAASEVFRDAEEHSFVGGKILNRRVRLNF